MKLTDSDFDSYENALKNQSIIPGFFVSAPYFRAAGWRVLTQSGINYMVVDSEDNIVLAPVSPIDGVDYERGYSHDSSGELYDTEYLYDLTAFDDISGRRFSTFRKNVNHFEKNHPVWWYLEVPVHFRIDVFIEWLKLHNDNRDIYDCDTIVKYLSNPDNKCIGVYVGGDLLGMNLWDENFSFINFRYCFTVSEERGLSDFLRYQFFKSMCTQKKLINDGGDLGEPGLRFLKKRLNPLMTIPIYSTLNRGGISNVRVFT